MRAKILLRTPLRIHLGRLLVCGALVLGSTACERSGGGSSRSRPAALPPDFPVALIEISPGSGTAPLTVAFDGAGSIDPEGGELNFLWTLGNGEASTYPSGFAVYSDPGTYTLALTVTDADGFSDEIRETIVVDGGIPAETFSDRVVHLTNVARSTAGLPPLKSESRLTKAVLGHALDMAVRNFFDHTNPDGQEPWDRMQEAGYDWIRAGENIAAGQKTPEEVVQAWMDSPGHRQNILSDDFVEIGVAHHFEPGDRYPGPEGYHDYWVQDFGSRLLVFPIVIEGEAYSTGDDEVEIYAYGGDWAREMQISEDANFADLSWQPFESRRIWTLSPGPGLKRIYVLLRSGTHVRSGWDQIVRL